jgi:hypothetical protein
MKKNFGKNLLVLTVMTGYVWICLRLFFSGKISFYVHPDFVPLTLATGLVLLLHSKPDQAVAVVQRLIIL